VAVVRIDFLEAVFGGAGEAEPPARAMVAVKAGVTVRRY
jgi:hypothetical protein